MQYYVFSFRDRTDLLIVAPCVTN